MTVTREDLRAIAQHIQPLINQRVRTCTFGADGTLRVDFDPPLVPLQDGIAERVPKRLWLLDAMWRLETDVEVLIGSGDPLALRESAIQRLDGRSVRAVEVLPPGLESVIVFGGGVLLRLFPVHTREYLHWALLTADGHSLEIGPGTTWSYRHLAGPGASAGHRADDPHRPGEPGRR